MPRFSTVPLKTMLTCTTNGTNSFFLSTSITIFVQTRRVSQFTLYYFVLLRRFYVSKNVTSRFIIGRARVTSCVTEMIRIDVLQTRFAGEVSTLVILWFHFPPLYVFLTGRAFINQLTWYGAMFGTSFVSFVTLHRPTNSVTILAVTCLLNNSYLINRHYSDFYIGVSLCDHMVLDTTCRNRNH